MNPPQPQELTRYCPGPEDTRHLAHELGAALRGGEWLLLSGTLGAGKTTFVRGLAAALGWRGTVRSPTFTLVAAYPTRPRLVHVDLYRLESPAAVEDLGLEDLAGEEPAVVAVEWPGLLTDRPAREPVLEIEITPEHEGRRVHISASTVSAGYLLQGMGGP